LRKLINVKKLKKKIQEKIPRCFSFSPEYLIREETQRWLLRSRAGEHGVLRKEVRRGER